MAQDIRGSARVEAARKRLANPRDVVGLAVGIIVIVLGALMLAEAIVGAVNHTTLFFEDVNRGFEFVVGLMAIILGASLIPEQKE